MKEAQKHLAKNNFDKAIEVWQQIAKATPDGNTFNYLGDLYVKKGDKKAAVTEFHKAAEKYTNEGFASKALAIHKKVLNINPKDPGALIALGKLNEEKNIVIDAIKYYLAAADVLAKENRKDELIDVFDRVTTLAPTNIKLRIKVSELYSREGFIPEAAKEYCNVAGLHLDKNEMAGAEEYLNKAEEIMPGNKQVLMAQSDLAERKGDIVNAAKYLQRAIDRTGPDTEILMRKAKLLAAAGTYEEAIRELEGALASDPTNIDARLMLAEFHQQTGDIMGAWEASKQAVDDLISASRNEEAIGILMTFKELEPVDNRRKLITLFKLASDEDNAFAELFSLHDILMEQGNVDAAISCLKEAQELKPGDMLVGERIAELEAQVTPAAPEPEAAPEPDDEEPELGSFDDSAAEPEPAHAAAAVPPAPAEKTVADALSEADVFIKYSLFPDAITLLEEMKVKHSDSVELLNKLKGVYRDSGDKGNAITQCLEIHSLLQGQGNAAGAKTAIDEALSIDSGDPRLEQFGGGAAGLETAMGEADFYVQQGLLKEAADAYRKLISKYPGHEEIIAKLGEVTRMMNAPAAPAAPEPAPAAAAPAAPAVKPFRGEEAESDGLFDFDSILGEDDTSAPIDDMDEDVLSIFDEFKKGLAQEIATEDAATHYDLGIAYKEMGIVEDSIKEFQTASRDPKFFTQASTMIGICYMSLGKHQKAADAFNAAIMKTNPEADTWWSLKYDLAQAYEVGGKKLEAFEIYREVYDWDVTFRDVSKKYEALKSEVGELDDDAAAAPTGPGPEDKPSSGKSRVSYI